MFCWSCPGLFQRVGMLPQPGAALEEDRDRGGRRHGGNSRARYKTEINNVNIASNIYSTATTDTQSGLSLGLWTLASPNERSQSEGWKVVASNGVAGQRQKLLLATPNESNQLGWEEGGPWFKQGVLKWWEKVAFRTQTLLLSDTYEARTVWVPVHLGRRNDSVKLPTTNYFDPAKQIIETPPRNKVSGVMQLGVMHM